MKPQYDVVIVGSGLGGLVSAVILAKEGYKVCVLEKNNQYGGNLQTFVRERTIFDTGIHYIGSLAEGENLNRYFSYLGIMEGLRLKKMDEDGFDMVSFGDTAEEFPHAQGHENFIRQLSGYFPQERAALEKYCQLLQETCAAFPLYYLSAEGMYDTEVLSQNAKEVIDQLTTNEKLRQVLAGSNFLYAGIAEKTPWYVHALSVNSYIQSAWRCINGGSQITKQLIRQLRNLGAEVYKHQEVVSFLSADNRITAVQTKGGNIVGADLFISNIEPKTTLKMVDENLFRKSYFTRLSQLEDTISAFSLYVVLKPGTYRYDNRNYYHFKRSDWVWTAHEYNEDSWPKSYMASMNASAKSETWADGMTFLTYMHFDEVRPWANTFNTTAEKNDRGETYEQFKARKAAQFLAEIQLKFPGITDCIQSIHTSTPLSYRDYIGTSQGNMYGYVKDSHDPMKTFIGTKTKIDNLYLTGQSTGMHGVLGVTIGAVATCSEIIGKEYLVNKINASLQHT